MRKPYIVTSLMLAGFIALLAASVPPAFGSKYAGLPLPLAFLTLGIVLHVRLAPARLGEGDWIARGLSIVGLPFIGYGGWDLARIFADFPPGVALPTMGPMVLAALAILRIAANVPRLQPWRRLELPLAGLASVAAFGFTSLVHVAERHVPLIEWVSAALVALTTLLAAKNLLGERDEFAEDATPGRHEPFVRALPDRGRVELANATRAYLAGGDPSDYRVRWERMLLAVRVPDDERARLLDLIQGVGRDLDARGRVRDALVEALTLYTDPRRAGILGTAGRRPNRVNPTDSHAGDIPDRARAYPTNTPNAPHHDHGGLP